MSSFKIRVDAGDRELATAETDANYDEAIQMIGRKLKSMGSGQFVNIKVVKE